MLEIVPVNAFKDNYIWTLRSARHAAVVDQGEATVDRPVAEGDTVSVPELGASFSVLDIPGHTRAHVAYYGAGALFCGDMLFACGCGRLFEGTAQQMYASLSKLASLPDETKVYCAREYTLATLPSRLGEEKATNPFLRCLQPAVIESANKYLGARAADPVRVFAAIRDWKNRF
ncbi:MAG: hydroxyacylglutathione hydrolase C-terminal domain-containing protein [Betaproteobacteria bacterium]